MTRDDIIRIAFERMTGMPGAWTMPALMQARNAFIAGFEHGQQAEREECAKVCEDQADDGSEGEWDGCCLAMARHIRARGQA
jgi:hypothetical protein